MPETGFRSVQRLRGRSILLAGLAMLLTGGSCIDPNRGRDHDHPSRAVPLRRTLDHSVEGRPVDCVIFGSGRDCVLILATIHGDEDAGTPLVHRLIDFISADPAIVEDRRIVIVPVANPDGMANQTRTNARGVDLNRNFPAGNFSEAGNHGSRPLSEPESTALHALLDRERPRRIVSIHQPLNYGTSCIDYDGPAQELAEAMARQTDIPLKRIGSRPGSLGSYAGETLGIPIITLELPKEAKGRPANELWNDYGKMLLAAIRFPVE